MRILIINHYAGSPEYGMEFRPYYLAKEWQKKGHNVTIVAGSYSHLRSSQPKPGFEIINGIKFFWIKTIKYQGNGILRLFSMIQFVFKLYILTNRIIKDFNPEIVIASSTYPLDIYPAHLIAKKNNSKLVFELHDMWPLSPMIIGGFSKYHPFIWLLTKAENFACKKSHFYISLLGNAKTYLIQNGLKEEKFIYVPNGFSSDEINETGLPLPQEHQKLLERLKNESKFIIGYTGGHSPSNALKSLLLATKNVAKYENISFVLVGDGSQKNELLQYIQNSDQKNVFFLPSINKKYIPSILSNFDVLYAGGVSSILHSYGTSYNKVIDYMLAGKPIIFAVDEPNSLVARVGCGIQIAAENGKELIEVIEYFSNLSLEKRIEMGMKGRQYAIKELNYTTLAKKIIDAIEK